MKCKELEKTAKMMDDDIIQCMKFAEEKRDLGCVIKGNRLKIDRYKKKRKYWYVREKSTWTGGKEKKIEVRNEYIK